MNKAKRVSALLLTVVMIFSCVSFLSACKKEGAYVNEHDDDDAVKGSTGTTESNTQPSDEVAYQVEVMDADGTPYTDGVVVKFMQNGAQKAMQPASADGIALKNLPKGNYVVELAFTDKEKSFYYEPVTLTAEQSTAVISLQNMQSAEGRALSANGQEYTAYYVGANSTRITVKANVRNYFLFVPTEAGTYQFSVDNQHLAIGNYGTPHFVQEWSISEVVDNQFVESISQNMIGASEDAGTTVIVIGIDGTTEDTTCSLSIVRIGDPELTEEERPYTEYKTTAVLAPFTLSLNDGQKLTYVDITRVNDLPQIVLNEADGLYHYGTADGPVVYMNLGSDAPYISFKTVIQGEGSMGGAPVRKYFYDEDGEFVKKEDYTDILNDYFENMDQNLGVYPLTTDLIYIVQNWGVTRWTQTHPDYMPAFDGSNPEIAWMFALCYVA